MTDGLTLTLKNSLDEIPKMADAVEEFAVAHDIPMSTCLHVTLVLDELVTNVISYGYPDGPAGDRDIVVRMTVEDLNLTVVLEDDGRAFDPTSAPPPDTEADLEDRAIGGLGIHFVRNFMDSVHYQRANGYNRLTMRKSLVTEGGPA